MFEEIGAVIFIVCCIASLAFIFLGFKERYRYTLIKDTPRSKIRSLAMGLVEVHGRVKAGKILYSPFSRSQCVYYRYRVEEYTEHTRTDSDGNRETYYTWDTIDSGSDHVHFYAKDETGEVLVNPAYADYNISLKRMFYQDRGLWRGRGDLVPVDPNRFHFYTASEGDRRYYEYFLEPNETLFVIGTATFSGFRDGKAQIQRGKDEPTFIISNQGEARVLSSFQMKMTLFFALAFVFIIVGTMVLMFSMSMRI